MHAKYKSGDIAEAGMYRSVSIIQTFFKLMENIAMRRLITQINRNNLLTATSVPQKKEYNYSHSLTNQKSFRQY